MPNTNHGTIAETADDIRLVGINTDKTRRVANSEYHVYFLLSGAPTAAWRVSLLAEWAGLKPASAPSWPETGVDGSLLWIRCPLGNVATSYLPPLKKAVAAANVSNRDRLQADAEEEQRRRMVWQDERSLVDQMAASLRFD